MRNLLFALILILTPLGARAESFASPPAVQPAVVVDEGQAYQVVEILGLSERQLTGIAIGAAAGAILGTLLSSGSAPILAAVAGGLLGYWWSTPNDLLRRRNIGIDIACPAPLCAAPR